MAMLNNQRVKQMSDTNPYSGENHLQPQLKVLVLSAGGYGHVPIPLFKQPEETGDDRIWRKTVYKKSV